MLLHKANNRSKTLSATVLFHLDWDGLPTLERYKVGLSLAKPNAIGLDVEFLLSLQPIPP